MMNHEVIELRNMRMRIIEAVAKQSQSYCKTKIEAGLRNYGLEATQENVDAVVEIMRRERRK